MKQRLPALLAAVWLVFVAAFGLAAPARAASGDSIDNLGLKYTVNTDGSLDVDETIVYRFAPGGGERHGIIVTLPVREKYQGSQQQDRIYHIENLLVTSPSGDSSATTTSTVNVPGGAKNRDQQLAIKIGSSSRTIDNPTVTYHLTYRVTRAVMNNPHGDEIYWDAVTTGMPTIKTATIELTTPTDVVKTNCVVGATGSSSSEGCTVTGGTGRTQNLTASNIGAGQGLSFSTTFQGGAVNPNTPEVVRAGDLQQRDQVARTASVVGGATGLTGVLSLIGGLLFGRSRGRDERFQGVPPGLLPGKGQPETVARDDKPQIPVQFNPPPMSVGEAGMLDDGTVDVRDTAATLVDLAVRGYVKLSQQPDDEETTLVRLMRPDVPPLPHERDLLAGIFGAAAEPGMVVALGQRGDLQATHAAVSRDLTDAMQQRGWYKHMPHALSSGGLFRNAGGCFWIAAISIGGIGGLGTIVSKSIWLLPLLPLVGLAIWAASVTRRGQRSATGRAYADQIEGFRTYIATAEADQLKFEEGEDIFSKYLPWAIMFGLTDRWTKVCQQLVAMGRIPDAAPSWYYGQWYGWNYWNPMWLDNSLSSAAEAPVSSGSDADGSGSGSGFSGFSGGSVGGGGGGGSISSW